MLRDRGITKTYMTYMSYPESKKSLDSILVICWPFGYAQIVRYYLKVHYLEQIKNTISFMINYISTYFIDTRYSMRFVKYINNSTRK